MLRDPALWLTEIAWRWCFGASAFLLLLFPTLSLLGSISVSQADAAAWRSNDPTLMAQALASMLVDSGPRMLRVAAWVLPAITFLWIVLGAAGRSATVDRMGSGTISFRTVLALQCSRALVFWLAVAALIAAIVFDARVANRGPQPDLFLYYALAFWAVLLIGGSWAVTNWYLSLAPICSLRSGAGFLQATRQAVRVAKAQRGDLGGISLVFGLLRLVALAIAFVLCILPSGFMGTAPRAYTAWVVAVSLVYFAVADFLFLARMAAYIMTVLREADSVAHEAPSPRPVDQQHVTF